MRPSTPPARGRSRRRSHRDAGEVDPGDGRAGAAAKAGHAAAGRGGDRTSTAAPVTRPIQARVLTRTHQIGHRLPLRRRNMNRLEQPAREQTRQRARVARIGLDPITRPLRHQPRRDDPAVDPTPNEMPVEPEPGRARLVAAPCPRPAAQQPLHLLLVVGSVRSSSSSSARTAASRIERACTSGPTTTVVDSTTVGDRRTWLYRATPRQPTTDAQTPTTLEQQADAAARWATAPSCLASAW
jgi:hypothetical protein